MSIHKLLMHRPLMLEAKRCARLSAGPLITRPKLQIPPKGIIPIHGILTKHAGLLDDFWMTTAYDTIQSQIEAALADDSIDTILLDIDSPGGETSGLFDLADFIYEARSQKQIWAIANDEAYSAAYAIATCAHKIVINRTSGVGSIGVMATHVDQSSFDAQQGIHYTTVFAGNRKNDLTPHATPTPEALQDLQTEVDRLYDMFVDLVARNRDLTTQAVRDTQAGLFFGETGIFHKLADEVMTKRQCIDSATQKRSCAMTIDVNTDVLIAQGKALGRQEYQTELQELTRLCRLAQMPEKLVDCVEQNMNAEAASQHLMTTLAARSGPDIVSAIPTAAVELNPLLEAAKARSLKGGL